MPFSILRDGQRYTLYLNGDYAGNLTTEAVEAAFPQAQADALAKADPYEHYPIDLMIDLTGEKPVRPENDRTHTEQARYDRIIDRLKDRESLRIGEQVVERVNGGG